MNGKNFDTSFFQILGTNREKQKNIFAPSPKRVRNAEDVEFSTIESIKKLFNALTKGDKDITMEKLTTQIIESRITTHSADEIIGNIKQASVKTVDLLYQLKEITFP